jgi:hypothetical protein
MFKGNGWLLHGEWWDTPSSYDDNSCVFCKSFTSYGCEFEDDLEPADCGRCSVISGDRKHVSGTDTCPEFVISEFYAEDRRVGYEDKRMPAKVHTRD